MSNTTRYGARLAVLLIAILAVARPVAAAPDWSLRDYVQTTWTHRDGVSLASPATITQTTDGYLWFISQRVLVRFDGVRFVPVPVPCDSVNVLVAGDNGSLWMLCRDPRIQLLHRTVGGLITEVPLTGLRLTGGPGLFRDRRGRLWIYGDVLARLEPDGRFREVLGDLGWIRSVAEDVAGTIWLSTGERIVRIRGDRVEYSAVASVLGLRAGPSAGVFACGPEDRVRHLDGTSERVVARAPPEVNFVNFNSCMAVDAAGGLWVGTRQHGIALVQGDRVETLLARNDIGGSISTVFVDREDTVWVGSSEGLHRLRKPHARLLTSVVTAVPPNPVSVSVDSRGDIWIQGTGQLVRLNLASGTHEAFDNWPLSQAIGEDEDGRVWLARDGEIGFLDAGRFQPVDDATGAPVRGVWSFTTDADGHLWAVAKDVGVYQVTPAPPHRVYDEPDAGTNLLVSRHGVWVTIGLSGVRQHIAGRQPVFHDIGGDVLAFFEDRDVIWIGAQSGLSRWRGGRWTIWTRAHGLPGTGAVQEITRDRLGRLWLMTSGGIIAVSSGDLDATPDGEPRPLRFAQIGSLDRVVPHPGPPVSSPRVSLDRDGHLYFATLDSVAIVDPAAVTTSSLRPAIVIESVVADNAPVDPIATHQLTVPSRLQFEYTSLSLRSPENNRFRYRLDGYDEDWIEAGNAREVTYGTLPAGSYRFHVIGSGSEGVWNDDGATFAFEIVPLFYNTWWFRTLVLAIVAAAVGGMHRLRVRRLAQQMHMRFEERLAERTRIARDLHDTLLQGTLAASLHVQLADDALTEVSSSPPVEDARAPLRRAMQILSQVVNEGRATVGALRMAPSPADLAEMLYQAARNQPNQGEVNFRVIVDGAVRPLSPGIADDVGYVAREAVINAYKHSRARHIEAELIYTRSDFRCIVRDDGQGLDEGVLEHGRDGHWGLIGMRERAERVGGELHLRSRATAGTEVELLIKGRVAYRGHTPATGEPHT